MVTLNDTHTHTHMRILLCMRDRPVVQTSTWQYISHEGQAAMSAAGFEHNSRKRGVSDVNLRTRGHWDRPLETDLTYVGKEEICFTLETWYIFSVLFFIIFRLCHNCISLYSSNTFSINHALKLPTHPGRTEVNVTQKQVFFYVHGSAHHSTIHTEKSNKMQQCIEILLFHIYMKLNMFRATHHPSSGA